uniref:TP53 induced glycolysis regulatory phosphatase a n=1 Tax=Poecilia latipinna TaxID=48699 RepID=A0A3B3UVE5_9TELE
KWSFALDNRETEYNKAGLLQGQAVDSSLSETGRQQAAAAGSYLRDVGFSNVFSSDMRRAQQTAEKIMQQNSSCLRLQMVCDPLLKEKSFGVAEGGRVEDLREMARAAGEPFPGFTPPGGETPDQVRNLSHSPIGHQVAADSQKFFRGADVSSAEGGPDNGMGPLNAHALVVSHGAYMCVAVRYFVEELRCSAPAGCDRKRMFSLSPNAGICRFNLTVVRQGARYVVSGMRCVFIHRVGGAEQDE